MKQKKTPIRKAVYDHNDAEGKNQKDALAQLLGRSACKFLQATTTTWAQQGKLPQEPGNPPTGIVQPLSQSAAASSLGDVLAQLEARCSALFGMTLVTETSHVYELQTAAPKGLQRKEEK